MGNKTQGIIDLVAGDRVLKFQFTFNALCAIEDATGKALQDVMDDMADGTVRAGLFRTLFWAGLCETWPDVTEQDAGRVIDQIGGMVAAAEMIQRAFTAAMPEIAEGDDGGPEGNVAAA